MSAKTINSKEVQQGDVILHNYTIAMVIEVRTLKNSKQQVLVAPYSKNKEIDSFCESEEAILLGNYNPFVNNKLPSKNIDTIQYDQEMILVRKILSTVAIDNNLPELLL